MDDLKRVKEAFDAAREFLNPVLDRDEIQKFPGQSLLGILSSRLPCSPTDESAARRAVVGQALDILDRVHTGFVTPVQDQHVAANDAAAGEDTALEDAKRRRLLHALLDLISLEGIYPSLSSGVGIPLQQRIISVLPAGVIAKQTTFLPSSKPHDETLLCVIMKALLNIMLETTPSIQPVIRGRILSDIVSGTADLAFNPNISNLPERSLYANGFARIIEDTPSATLLPMMSSFLQADTTPWFKSTVSGQISHVPLRQGGVVHTIMFIASQFAPSLGQEAQSEPSNGPHLTVQAIMQTSRLLSSVPQGIEPTSYFKSIAPQLLSLLDGPDPDLKKTASYVIGSGILGKRAYGALGTIGHSIFVEPIFGSLTADLNSQTRHWMMRLPDAEGSPSVNIEDMQPGYTIVDGATVDLALDRLRSLALQHPNPSLVKRLIYPILLPLWGFACYSQEQNLTAYHERIMALLQTYFSISVGIQPLKKLVDHLLWDGGSGWTYSTDAQARIVLKSRQEQLENQSNIIRLIDSLQSRADLFVTLLGSDPSGEERTGDIFLYVSETWLVQSNSSKAGQSQKLGDSENIFQKLVSAKIAEKLLDNFKDTLSRRPLRVLELIKQVVDGELHRFQSQGSTKQDPKGKVSLSSLASIVPDEQISKQQEGDTSEKESSESLTTAFSLLSTVLSSSEFKISEATNPLLETIKERLDRLIPWLPPILSKPATTSSMLLEIQLTDPEHDDTKPTPPHVADLETHRRALTSLDSELPPVQAEGFSLLSKLVLKGSPVLDIPSTLTLLLSIITDPTESVANEEFIYLNAIKLTGTLASRHPRTVIKTLVENYADKSEQRTLDQRLKIGESLLRTVQDLGDVLSGETAKILGDTMITVAGRRGHRPETQKERKAQLEKERRKKEHEDRKMREPALPPGWKFSTTPTPPKNPGNDEEENSDAESPEQIAHAANVVATWAAGAANDEEPDDLRVRASALSILASAVQVNAIGLGPEILSSAIELALATLTLDQAPENAILRRASVVLILDILKALDTAREAKPGRDIGFGFSLRDDSASRLYPQDRESNGPSTIGNIPHMLRKLAFVESKETDGIVRGHLRALIESLEAWLEKSLLWGISMQTDGFDEPSLGLGDRIAGLDVDPLAGRRSGQPRIEEIE
ncbi:hypothetical protein N7532_004980 [Penicillium argentinense]|uniref:Protein required for cell viability n=1 Tax=Penicillium argentinense TaxID=1131581 RepID=A0A9W9K9D9_9EURO|nr:uncharacterized protein N7532_004980 [Penicillium argentinense]KAJ5097979.1 hypothetical protein N7532_004980 [Penicillium argentinense]